jgi:hypothetical protein
MAWDTKLVTQIVAGRLDDLDALRETLTEILGATPSMTLRLEIRLNDEQVTISVTDDGIAVRDEKRDRLIAAGDYELARAAIKGYASSTLRVQFSLNSGRA